MKKHLALIACWVVIFTLTPVKLAWAYIDPATTTYIIQVSAAIVITLGVSLSIFIYKFQMIITNIKVSLHALIRRFGSEHGKRNASATKAEEAAVTLTEEDALRDGVISFPVPVRETYHAVVAYSDDLDAASSLDVAANRACEDTAALSSSEHLTGEEREAAEASSSKELTPSGLLKRLGHWLWDDELGFKDRFMRAALVAAAIAMTYGAFNMIDSFITNKSQLFYSFPDVVGPLLLFSLIMFSVVLLVLLCFKGRVFTFFICTALGFLVCGYLQSTFFNTGIGQLIGQPLGGNLGSTAQVINLIIWITLFVVIFFLGFAPLPGMKRVFKGVVIFVPSLLIAVQIVALFSIITLDDIWDERQGNITTRVLSQDRLFEISSRNNVLVFIVDTMDEDSINALLGENPRLLDNLDGFTRFTNATSVYNMTYPSIAHLFSDEPLDVSITANEYFDRAYANPSFVNEIQRQGFTSNIFTEIGHSYRNEKQLEGIADNLEEGAFSLRPWRIPLQFFRLSLLKSAPYSLKHIEILYPDLSYSGVGSWESGAVPFFSDDPLFYDLLINERLSTVNKPHFAFYHLNGFHPPWNMDARAQHVSGGVNPTEQYLGSFFILSEYFKQLKELGLYKDVTIIIIGDHPQHQGESMPTKPLLIGCFVKPTGEEGTPLQTSEAPVSILNLRSTCVEAAGGNYRPWGPTFFEVDEDAVVVRDFYNRFTDKNGKHFLAHFLIHGDARNWDNWEMIEVIPISPENWF